MNCPKCDHDFICNQCGICNNCGVDVNRFVEDLKDSKCSLHLLQTSVSSMNLAEQHFESFKSSTPKTQKPKRFT